jgi:uncharacterized protein (DUF433 family)
MDDAVSAYARRTQSSKSAVILRALREWLVTQGHPLIHFVPTLTGERRAALLAGPQVWTVAEAWLQHEGDERTPAVVADSVGLTVADVEAALAYWADHRAEIDDILEQHRRDQDEALAAWERRQALMDAR